MLDFTFSYDHSITVLTPITTEAQYWCDNHLPDDCPKWGGGYAIESNYFLPIYDAIQTEGLTIEY